MFKLLDLLSLRNIRPTNYKIHLATGSNPTPLDAFIAGKFQEWQEEQNNQNFKCKQILSLIDLPKKNWLFAGIYEVEGVTKLTDHRYKYQTKKVEGMDDLIGRVIVSFARSRASYIWGDRFGNQLEVEEIRPETISMHEFPGYNKVMISHYVLKTIINQQETSWRVALSKVRGVYLIADRKTGKLYIGSASGTDGIWQRWTGYAINGHGGNEQLSKLIDKLGIGYADNFHYSILEFMDFHSDNNYILEREMYWKDALLTRQYGYN